MTRFVALAAAMTLLLGACASIPPERAGSGNTPASGTLFVANKRGDSLSKIDLASGREVARVAACRNPHELAPSPDGAHVALACYGGTSVDLFRAADLERVKRIDLGANARPHGIVWLENGDLYATAEGRRSIFWIRDPLGRAELFEYGTGREGSHMLAVAPNGRYAWTTDLGSRTVTRLDLVTRRAPLSIEVGVEPEGIALSPDGETLWVSARGSDRAFALDPQSLTVRREVATGDFPLRILVRPQGDVAITSDLADGALSVIDTATGQRVRTIPVSSRDEAEARQQVTILWSRDGRRIYVAETGTDTVAEVDFATGKVLRRLTVGAGGDGLAIID